MKKLIVMLLMMVASAFASQLFALDGSPPTVGSYSTNSGEMIYDKNGLGLVGAARADDVTFAKVNILHKDTLIHSWGEGIDNKIPGISGGYIQNINIVF